MQTVIEIAQAMLITAAAMFALLIAITALYTVIVGIQSAIEERKKKGKKK